LTLQSTTRQGFPIGELTNSAALVTSPSLLRPLFAFKLTSAFFRQDAVAVSVQRFRLRLQSMVLPGDLPLAAFTSCRVCSTEAGHTSALAVALAFSVSRCVRLSRLPSCRANAIRRCLERTLPRGFCWPFDVLDGAATSTELTWLGYAASSGFFRLLTLCSAFIRHGLVSYR
jgi:hypothetical protein